MSDNDLKVGDKVRSFDFDSRDLEGERASFVEGTVTGFRRDTLGGFDRVVVWVDRAVFGGKEVVDFRNVPSEVSPPVNGTPRSFGGVTDGVVKLPNHSRKG